MIPLVFLIFKLTFIAKEVCFHPSLLVSLSVCLSASRMSQKQILSTTDLGGDSHFGLVPFAV